MTKSKEATPAVAFDYSGVQEEVEKRFKLVSNRNTASNFKIPTGQLVTDLLFSGGIRAGRWYTIVGPEASGKSTAMMSMAEMAVDANVPIIWYFDYESSLDPEYMVRMMKRPRPAATIFGERDEHGRRVTPGRIRLFEPDSGEEFFEIVSGLLRRLPDKVYVEERKKWYLVFKDTKDTKSQKVNIDSKLSGDGFFYVEAENDAPQALIMTDSYPAMTPAKLNEDEAGAGLAAKARMWAEHINRVKPLLNKKQVTVIGVNQLRMKIGFVLGSPETEPCGEAVKFATDGKIKVRGVSVPKHCYGKGKLVEENSVLKEGGIDTYRYIKMDVTKHKMGPNFRSGYARIWMQDADGEGRGYDTVFDSWEYLRLTGQITGSMKKFTLAMVGTPEIKGVTWNQFKRLVLLKKDPGVLAELGLKTRPLIRKFCKAQIASGEANALYVEQASKKSPEDEE